MSASPVPEAKPSPQVILHSVPGPWGPWGQIVAAPGQLVVSPWGNIVPAASPIIIAPPEVVQVA